MYKYFELPCCFPVNLGTHKIYLILIFKEEPPPGCF